VCAGPPGRPGSRVGGRNERFFSDTSVLRERHFLLVLIALVYRFSLIETAFVPRQR
jgi:hypothetical protein